VLLKESKTTEINVFHTANGAGDWLQRNGREVTDHAPYSSYLANSDFRLFGLLKKYLAGKRFATDAAVKQAVNPR
jgi:hypothetical protein